MSRTLRSTRGGRKGGPYRDYLILALVGWFRCLTAAVARVVR